MRREAGILKLYKLSEVKDLVEDVKELFKFKPLIACVGTELRGDDRAGLEVCRALRKAGFSGTVIECEYGLENCLHVIEDLKPKHILVVDAAILPSEADFVLASPNEVETFVSLSTHSIPLDLITKILKDVMGVESIFILGIAAENLDISLELSDVVVKRIEVLTKAIVEAFLRSVSEISTCI